jgi:hypothetical protein
MFMVVLFLPVFSGSACAIPAAEDINSLAEAARLTTEKFARESFEPRLTYELSGKFLNAEDRENLHKLAKTAADHLDEIANAQQKLKQQIEDYEGDDWDIRYGSTGLWRKLFRDMYITSLGKCEIDFYRALSVESPQRNEILHKVLAQIGSLDQTSDTAHSQFLKAKTLALLARTDPSFRQQAKEQLGLLRERSDVPHSIALRTSIERIKLLGPSRTDELEDLVDEIAQSDCSGDRELLVSLASLLRRHDPNALEKAIKKWPRIEEFFGSCVLSELLYYFGQDQLDLRNVNLFEAELAAQAAWKNNPQQHKELLRHLASLKRLQTPLILYVTAMAFTDSSPVKTVNLLIHAGRLQQLRRGHRLQKSGREIAEQAAQLAYNLFAQHKGNCPSAVEAFDNYCTIAAEEIDEELEYLHSIVLNSCGLTEKGTELLKKIAGRPAGKWRNQARLDLILQAIEHKQHKNQKQRIQLLKQLNDVIADCMKQREDSLRIEAIAAYCPLLLESKDRDSAVKVLNILTEAETNLNPHLNVFKSKALQQLGRVDEAADCLLRAIDPNSCQCVTQAMQLLAEVVDEIDRFLTEDLSSMDNCRKLAELCHDCLEDTLKQKAALFLIEISVFAATEASEKLSPSEKLLDALAKEGLTDDIDFIRCRARLSAKQRKFGEAAAYWAKVAKMRTDETGSTDNRRSWKWWRAKFYELDCRRRWPQTDKVSLLHTIEVLENTYPEIPPFWAQELNSLKHLSRK